MTKRTYNVAISSTADIGCDSFLAGIKVIHKLGINQNELIPVNINMHAANNKGITILGATILRISDKDDQNRPVENRYRYKTAPQGYIASGDDYTRRFDEIVADIPNKTKCVDDVLWAGSIVESFFQSAIWLDICGRHLKNWYLLLAISETLIQYRK
ncbi:unnamed protein product [Mytilus coruscus]|uniref:Uncharacterized protein n=1 Tax=Mytilus coruscus TaxID=42192 RepID=A0A6J8CAA9_MYTCO|nr:unnamed protein product [Mytilus coruscus]